MKLTETDLKAIGDDIGGSFHHEEGDTLVFGSHTWPSHRITVERAEAEDAIRTLRKREHIETADETPVLARVFRLFSRDGTGACKRDLWVRFDWTECGWTVAFYKTGRKAKGNDEPLVSVPANVADLAQEAYRRLNLLQKSGCTGYDQTPVYGDKG